MFFKNLFIILLAIRWTVLLVNFYNLKIRKADTKILCFSKYKYSTFKLVNKLARPKDYDDNFLSKVKQIKK